MNIKFMSKSLSLFSALAVLALCLTFWVQIKATAKAAPATSTQVGGGKGSNNPLGNITVSRIGFTPNNTAFGLADTVEVAWEAGGANACVTPNGFTVKVTVFRDIAGSTTKSLSVSGGARAATLNFGTRFLRGVKSIEATVTATADLKAENKKSQNF